MPPLHAASWLRPTAAVRVLLAVASVQLNHQSSAGPRSVGALENGLGRRPAMGYNTWNDFQCTGINQDDVLQVMCARQKLGALRLGSSTKLTPSWQTDILRHTCAAVCGRLRTRWCFSACARLATSIYASMVRSLAGHISRRPAHAVSR